MKSKLEEKKLELANESLVIQETGRKIPKWYVKDFMAGFDAGIAAYKEMLYGVGVEGAEKRWVQYEDKFRIETSYQFNLTKTKSDDKDLIDPELDERPLVVFIEALPVLAKLQQQAEKIEEFKENLRDELKYRQECLRSANIEVNSLKSKITELEKEKEAHTIVCNQFFTDFTNRIEKLVDRLKEAEIVIKNWIDWEELQIKKYGGYVGKEINELISAARQYMEKVK